MLAVLVDRSESMASCHSEVEGGLNRFLKNQSEQPGLHDVMLAQFNTEYEIVVPPTRFTGMALRYVLEPRGESALLDNMGRFITEVGEALAKMPEKDRPAKVIVCIVTAPDGQEDHSVKWSKEDIKKLVQHQRDQYHWEFIFLVAAHVREVGVSAAVGVPIANMDSVAQACHAALDEALAATSAVLL